MRDEEIRERFDYIARNLSRIAYGIVDSDDLANKIMQEFEYRLEPAFVEVARRISEAVREVTGNHVRAKFLWYEFIGEELLVSSWYELVDIDSKNKGKAKLLGRVDFTGGSAFILEPVVRDNVKVNMYGGEIDRMIEQAIADELSQEKIPVIEYEEVFDLLVSKYYDLLYSGAKDYEGYLRATLSTDFNVDMEDVVVKLFDIEVEPENRRMTMRYLFKIYDVGGEADITGMITVVGVFESLDGYLHLYPENVDVKYKVHRKG